MSLTVSGPGGSDTLSRANLIRVADVQNETNVCDLAEALNAFTLVWTNTTWQCQTEVTHDGVDAAISGLLDDRQTNWIQTFVTGPGMLSFHWKVHQ